MLVRGPLFDSHSSYKDGLEYFGNVVRGYECSFIYFCGLTGFEVNEECMKWLDVG